MSTKPIREEPLSWLLAKVVILALVAVLCGWLCYEGLHYALTTPRCEQVGTCSAPPATHPAPRTP